MERQSCSGNSPWAAAFVNPAPRVVHDQLTHVDPAPHREIFLRPFHRDQTAEFADDDERQPIHEHRTAAPPRPPEPAVRVTRNAGGH